MQVYNTSNVDLVFDERSMKKKQIKEQFKKSNQEALAYFNITAQERLKLCFFQWSEDNFQAKRCLESSLFQLIIVIKSHSHQDKMIIENIYFRFLSYLFTLCLLYTSPSPRDS